MSENSKEVLPQLIDNVTVLITNVIDIEVRLQALTNLLIRNNDIKWEEFNEMRAIVEGQDLANIRKELLDAINKIPR